MVISFLRANSFRDSGSSNEKSGMPGFVGFYIAWMGRKDRWFVFLCDLLVIQGIGSRVVR